LKSGDVALFTLLNNGLVLTTTQISRVGNVVPLEKAPDSKIGLIRYQGKLGDLSLAKYLVHPQSRAQGMLVVHQGRILLEEYPGMREHDNKAWMSNAKTVVGFITSALMQEGKIDPQKPIETYLPEFGATAWRGTKVMDILDMASGMDVVETPESRKDPKAPANRYNLAAGGSPNSEGVIENQVDVIKSAGRLTPPGQAFDYASINTTVLGLLAERVENKLWADIVQQRIWSKMTVEGDLLYATTPQGLAQVQGMAISRLRDMARWGMLYTPSWSKAARERIVPEAFVRELQTGGRPDLFLKGEMGNRMSKQFAGDVPKANHYQWDAVFADGDIYKSGTFGQGLYVSPAKDLVIVWFSTTLQTDLTHYARLIAKSFPAGK
jgi:CubicO group peptidase (beta-lactamase class C family)